MIDAVKPLPCPFCGESAERVDIPAIDPREGGSPDAGGSYIACTKCGNSTKIYFGEKEGLLESWNRRTPPAGWKPIETAPKDGTRILMWDAEFTEWKIVQWDIGEPSILCGDEKYWVTDSEGPNPDNHIVENPKYWMPLPAAPENDDEQS